MTVKEALASKKGRAVKAAIEEEIRSLLANGTWELVPQPHGGGAASMKSAGNESESRDDRFPGQFFFVSTQAPAGPEKDKGFEEPAAVGKVTLHSLDYWVIDSGATYSMTPRADLLTEIEPSPVKPVTSALGQRAEVKGMGKAMFKGADRKMVGLKNVLWVPNLAANLISVRRLQKAGMDTSLKGAKTYTARLGERILWDLHKDRDQRQGLHVPAAEEEGRGKRRIQAPNRLTYDALGKPANSALAGAALMVGEDEESDYEECAFAFFSPVEMPGEPAILKEALESSDAEEWKKAMESELKSIEENGTWELVELLEGRKAIMSKCLFKINSDADGKFERYKSRLVAKGYQQKEKVDYKELFAPVVKPTTLRTLLAGAAIKGWVVKQMDVTTAFLNGVLEEEIFMAQPEGFDDGSGRVLKLKKALYGLKQAPRQWYLKCKALGDVSFYLGPHIEREVEKRCMWVHQRKYLEALAANFGQSEGHVARPFPSGFNCVKGPEEESVGEEERRRFHSLVGSLMFAAVNTRPDVAFATGQLARVVQCPNEEQVAAGMRVAKYLGQTPTVGLQFSAAAQRRQKGADGVEPGRLFLTAFSYASYASEPEDMTSVGGFIFCVGGDPTAWESKKQVDQA
ncbi:unnamed protein product [Closterium sp. NIES-53]